MIRVEKFIPGGFALGTKEDGKKVFFWNALPGELVTDYKVTKNKSSYEEAIALAIAEPSPYRTEPKDPHFLSTSPWQILDYTYELEIKKALIVEMFKEHHLSISEPEIVTDGKDYFYRNKMEYALYYDKEKQIIFPAFHARGSHQKIPITSSSLERPEIFQKATEIIKDLNDRGEEARKYQSLLLRCNQNGEVSGGLYENQKPHPVFPILKDKILGHTYSYSPNGFFQINLPVYELALKEIKNHIKTKDVLDLYAGVGTIGLSTTTPDNSLTLVESNKSAFRELEENCNRDFSEASEDSMVANLSRLLLATSAKVGNHRVPIFSTSENALDYIRVDQTVIVDPPRAGLAIKLVDKLLEVLPKRIIYLSCNPSTQARDIKILSTKYSINLIKAFNFFPHTPHIENLVVLSRI